MFGDNGLYRESWKKVAAKLNIQLPGCTPLVDAPAVILLAIVERIEKLEKEKAK